jgi:hypothetical protein
VSEKIVFDYFYGQEADMHSFYRIPKLLFTNDQFKLLSTDAKVLYGLMLDRMSLSIKNKWFDKENKAYIYFSIENTMEMLGCKKNKAIDTIKELDAETGIGLIEKKRQGQGKPAIIYVKSFVIDEPEVGKTNFLELEKGSSGSLKSKPLEVGKKDANKNNIINTDFSKTNLIVSDDAGKGLDEYTAYSEIIRENLELEILYQRYPYDVELIDGIYDLVLETVLCKSGTVIIASNEYPVQLVKSKFLKLNSSHIEYVIGCLKSNTSKVRNIKKYLLASLFNAPTTIQGYFQAEVNHDMPQFASVR